MADWQQLTLGDFIQLKRGYDLPKKSRSIGRVPLISSSGISDYVAESKAEGPGVVTGRYGTIGEVFYIEGDFWPLNTTLYVSDFKGNDPRFVSYFLRGIDYFSYSDKAAVPGVNRNHLHQAHIQVPSTVEEQRQIATALSTLDDKIELNRRMNETLEAQARALFRDWFVDFGPVKAKMAGDTPYLAPDLWSLFPNRLDDDGVPEGWLTYRVDEIADHHTKSLKPMDAASEFFEHFSLPAYDGGQQPVLEAGGGIKSNKTIVPDGAILLSKLNPEIPRVWWPQNKGAHRQIASTEFLAFTAKSDISPALIYSLFSDQTFRQRLEGMVTGTSKSHQRVSPPALRSLEALVGDTKVFAAFGEIATSLMQKVLANRAENLTLAQTRDLLLPKLMSGEIRVGDVASEELSAA